MWLVKWYLLEFVESRKVLGYLLLPGLADLERGQMSFDGLRLKKAAPTAYRFECLNTGANGRITVTSLAHPEGYYLTERNRYDPACTCWRARGDLNPGPQASPAFHNGSV